MEILESGLLTDLFEAFRQQQYQAFCNAPEPSSIAWAKAKAAVELQHFIENKCRDIVDGAGKQS